MDFSTLETLRKNHPAWRLLMADSAPRVASFLHRSFIARNLRTISQQELVAKLEGDIDTHGFAILDSLRAFLPHARSFLMDRETLLAHQSLWVDEPERLEKELPRLTAPEASLYDELRADRLVPHVRLEQERISFGFLQQALDRLLAE